MLAGAFLVRLHAAWGTFLDADEALHFSVANQHSLLEAYKASFTVFHPPLLILVLYFWRALGTSEVVLRLPSILAGTAFCWIVFRWVTLLFSRAAGWAAFLFAAFLPPTIALSAEIRQYALLMFFAATAAYLLELALRAHSSASLLGSFACLYLALLSHYSGAVVATALGVYGLVRILRPETPRRLAALWVAGQAGGIAVCVFLYFTSLREQGKLFRLQPLHEFMSGSYLHNSYFDSAQRSALWFLLTRTGSVFQYIFGQLTIGDVASLAFVAGVILIWRSEACSGAGRASHRQLVLLLVLPFVLDCALGMAGVYPYGGTRHCIFLAPFALAGIGYLIASALRQRAAAVAALSIGIAAVCNALPARHLPYISRADQNTAHMRAAVEFIERQIPTSDWLLADNQTGLLLAHYLCHQQPVTWDTSVSGFQMVNCGGHRVLATNGDTYLFNMTNFSPVLERALVTERLKPGETVWVAQAGWLWEDGLAERLAKVDVGDRGYYLQSFGKNITISRITVGGAASTRLAAAHIPQ